MKEEKNEGPTGPEGEMMRKKILRGSAGAALAAAAVSAALLAGCGGKAAPKAESPAGTETTAAAEQSGSGKEAAEESSAETAAAGQEASGAAGQEGTGAANTETGVGTLEEEKAGGEAEAVRPLGIESGGVYAYHYDPEIRPGEYDYASSVSVEELFADPETAEKYPLLARALEAMNEKNRSVYLPELPNLAESCRGLDEAGTSDYKLFLRRADSEVLSFQAEGTGYTGGAHGYEVYGGKNLDPETGLEIVLTDVVKDVEGLKEVLADQLEAEYSGGADGFMMLFDDFRSTIGQMETDSFAFTVEQDGVNFWFSPYDIGPYASGMLDTKVRYADHPELFTGKYTNASEDYTQQFEWMYPFEFTRADGTPASLAVRVSQDEYGTYTELSLELDGKGEYKEDDYFYSLEPLFVHTAEKGNFLYLITSSDNDYTFVKIFDLNGPAPVKTGELSAMGEAARDATGPEDEASGIGTEEQGGVHDNVFDNGWRTMLITDPARFILEKRIEDISTYSGTQHFRVGEEGIPEALDGRYMANHSFTVTPRQDFSAREADPETFKDGRKITVPAGTPLTVRYSEGLRGEGRVWFEDEDGRLIVIEVTKGEDWSGMVDGVRVIDLFEGIIFAG